MPLSAHQTPTDTTDDLEEVLSTADIKSLKQKSVSGRYSFFSVLPLNHINKMR